MSLCWVFNLVIRPQGNAFVLKNLIGFLQNENMKNGIIVNGSKINELSRYSSFFNKCLYSHKDRLALNVEYFEIFVSLSKNYI